MIGADLSGITPISSDVSHNLPKSNSSPGREKTHPARQKLNGRVSDLAHEGGRELSGRSRLSGAVSPGAGGLWPGDKRASGECLRVRF
jgi:hypothetical protein